MAIHLVPCNVIGKAQAEGDSLVESGGQKWGSVMVRGWRLWGEHQRGASKQKESGECP